MKTEVGVRGFFSSFFHGPSAGRGEGGADVPAAHTRPSEHAAAPARPASADAIKEMMFALDRGHQAPGGVPGGGSTDDAAGSGSEGQQGSGTHLAGQVAVAGDGALVNIGKEIVEGAMSR